GPRGIPLAWAGVAFCCALLVCPHLIFARWDLLVSSTANSSIIRYNGITGAFKDTLVSTGGSGLAFPIGVVVGADRNLYVCSSLTNSVLRFSADSGTGGQSFASSGGLTYPQALTFGPDSNLYVGGSNNAVLRYDHVTGQFLGAFTSGGPLNGAFG